MTPARLGLDGVKLPAAIKTGLYHPGLYACQCGLRSDRGLMARPRQMCLPLDEYPRRTEYDVPVYYDARIAAEILDLTFLLSPTTTTILTAGASNRHDELSVTGSHGVPVAPVTMSVYVAERLVRISEPRVGLGRSTEHGAAAMRERCHLMVVSRPCACLAQSVVFLGFCAPICGCISLFAFMKKAAQDCGKFRSRRVRGHPCPHNTSSEQ